MTLVIYAAAAVAFGTGIGFGRPALAWPLTAATAGLISLALVSSEGRSWAAIAAVVALGTAAGASASWRSEAAAEALLPRLAERGVVKACGTVRSLRPRSVEISADRVVRERHLWHTSEPLRVTGRAVKTLRSGERVCAKGNVHPARQGRDEAPLLVARTISGRGTGSVIRKSAGAVRSRFSDAARDALPKTQAGLLLGMTDGDVALLDDRTMESFRTTGLAHLVAVSGSNVAVVLAVVMLIARVVVRRRRWLRLAAAVPPLVFFAFLTGLEASVLRAVVTATIALVVTAEGRTSDGLRIASFAFIVLVLASPELEFHPGFQLSFAATLGLILWARPLTERIAARLPQGPVWFAAAAATACTIAAQAAAAPLLAWHFGRIPALGGLANLVVAPLAPVVMIGGVVTLGAASLVGWLDWAPATMRLPLDVILWCGRTFSELPSASVDASVLVGIALAAGLAAVLARSIRLRYGAVAVIVLVTTAAGGRMFVGPPCDGAAIVALDVGQGTAVLLRAGGHNVLVDGGPEAGGVIRDLDEQNVDSLDAVFVSHPHADHTDGVVDVLERLDVGAVIAPVTIGWGQGAEVVKASREARVPVRHTAAGDVHRFGPDLEIEVVGPVPGPAPDFAEDLVHAFSLVLRARVEGTAVLLPGDVGAEEEARLLESNVRAPVFVAPHHGSKDIDPRFVEAVEPRLTLVTVGADNRYGHPAPEAVKSYARHGRVFRTDRDGAVSVCVDESAVEVSTQR